MVNAMKLKLYSCVVMLFVLLPAGAMCAAQSHNRVTILFDAFGKPSSLKMDWGYSALVEYNGKRILFDAGNNADIFARNVKALGVDLSRLDFVVISHRHGDHTAGLHHLLRVNPKVKIYSPTDEHFGGPTPRSFFQHTDESLPPEMRYFGGHPPADVPHGSAWKDVSFIQVNKILEVLPGIRLIPTTSQIPGFLELRELSLSIQTAQGQVLFVGCSHSGIEKILEEATTIDQRVHMIFGGLHLLTTPEPEINRITTALRDRWKVEQVAPGHCTGEQAFASLRKRFGDRYRYAGVGTAVAIP
jgi:7,8-dihydropterin-6-yl-methyl-4-(beta-D-ribofuranosyl)aminobenzene 5'-phosphate synthase